uniref:Interleukin 6 receptor n=1 Tax=Lates calcarifer TaxID=8187 RepID=A0A4W6FW84_LATCA
MRIFLPLLSVLCATQVHSIFHATCPRKDPPPGVLVLSPGNKLVLTCKGHVTVDGLKVNIDGNSSNTNRGLTSTVAPTTIGNIVNTGHTMDSTVSETYHSESEVSTVHRWKWNGWTVGNGKRDWGEIAFENRGATLSLFSVRVTDSGKYTCHHRGRERFSLKVIVADPPETPSLSCYKRSPNSKIRCEWAPQKPVTKQVNCYLVLNKRPADTFHHHQCSYSSRLSRYWCALDHNEDELRTSHTAYLCVTSVTGNATSTWISFKPMDIIKPDPPSDVKVTQEEGHETWIKVTWNFPTSWKYEDRYYKLIYEVKYRPLKSSYVQVQGINTKRSLIIRDIMPGVEYLIQLRTKEEYDGRWSDWSTPVNGSSWTGKYTCKHAYAHEIKSSYFKIITGKWVCPFVAVEPVDGDGKVSHHHLWISGSFVLLLVILAAYIFRHKDRFMSKLHSMSVIIQPSDSTQLPPSAPAAPEGQALVTFTPPRYKEPPPSKAEEEGEEENEEEQRVKERIEPMHFNNTSYFLIPRE